MSVRLAGIVDKIVDGLMYVVNRIFQTVLQPIIQLIYKFVIWIPLEVINALTILFKFFASGFMGTIFGGSFVNGKISYSFNPFGGSTFETIVFFVVITSLIMFFIFMMASFISGLGPKGIGGKVFELKWIFISVAVLIVSPAVFIIADALMTTLMKAFDGSDPTKITGSDVSNLYNYFLNGDFATIKDVKNVQIGWDTTDPNGFQIGQSLLANLNELNGHVQDCLNQIDAYKDNESYDFGQLEFALETAKTDLTTCITYMSTTVNTDWDTFATMLSTWSPGNDGMFISDDNATTIRAITDNLENFQQSFVNLGTDYSLLTNVNCNQGWNTLNSFGDDGTHNWPVITAQVKAQFNQISESMIDTSGANNQLSYYFSLSSSSLVSAITYGSSNYIPLSSLYWCRQVSQPSTVVQQLYMVITGDNNPNNWDQIPKIKGKILGNWSILQFILGVFACWGMILIMYNFTSSAIKRTYYLIGYWLLGFYYLAGGTKGESATKKWYLRIWGKWFGIFVMYVCYTAASVVLNLIMPAINDSNSKLNADGQYNIGGIQVLVVLAVILAIEAAYQTAYQVSQAYLKQYDAGDEKFQAESPLSLVQQGKALFDSAAKGAEYWATGGPVKEGYKKYREYKDYWDKQKDAKKGNEQTLSGIAGRIAGMNENRDKLNAAGYDFVNPHGSDPGGIVRNSQKPVVTPAAKPDDKKTPAAGGGGGGGGGGGAAEAPEAPTKPDKPINSLTDPAFDKVQVPKDFVAYKDSDGTYLQGDQNQWYKAKTARGRIENLGRAALGALARKGEKLHNKAAALSRKLLVGKAAIGIAGIVGGAEGRAKAQRIFGDKSARISHGEKEFFRQQQAHPDGKAIGIAKDPNTGLVSIIPPQAPKGTTYKTSDGDSTPVINQLERNVGNSLSSVNKIGELTYS